MTNLFFSNKARQDLRKIQEYISNEQESPQDALKVIENILNRIERLISFPDTGTLLSPKINFPTNYRYARAASHLIFYRHENSNIYIDRIIHEKRDFIAILFPGNLND